MKRLLLWFGLIYGELNALVLLVVLVTYWVEWESGARFCRTIGLGTEACRSVLIVVVVVAVGFATLRSVRRFLQIRREDKS